MAVSDKLKELRKSRRLTQDEVAAGLHCSRETISRYENGIRQPAPETLKRLADFYGVSVDYLYGQVPPRESDLSEYEIALLTAFRKNPRSVQDDVIDFLNMKMSKREALKQ